MERWSCRRGERDLEWSKAEFFAKDARQPAIPMMVAVVEAAVTANMSFHPASDLCSCHMPYNEALTVELCYPKTWVRSSLAFYAASCFDELSLVL